MLDPRKDAAEAFVKSIRTGELSASQRLAPMLAQDVVFVVGQEEVKGYDAVLQRASGRWATTDGLFRAAWGDPQIEGDKVTVAGSSMHLPTGPAAQNFTFSFNAANQISRVEQQTVPRPQPAAPAAPANVIPLHARPLINNARVNNTPLVMAYTSPDGKPILSMRGSLQVYNDTQLCAWIRHSDGDFIHAIAVNPNVAFSFPFMPGHGFLMVTGKARVETDDDTRKRVFEMIPEQEQNHDPGRTGAALIVDVASMSGFTSGGGVRMINPAAN